MRRDQFEIDIHNVTDTDPGSTLPELHVIGHGSAEEIRPWLAGPGDEFRAADEIDVAFRFQSAIDADDPAGVLSVADRSTGAYILEVATPATTIERFVDAVERFAEQTDADRTYRLVVHSEDRTLVTYEKGLLLVYAKDGTLLRHRSLIPAGIEL